MYCFYSTRSGLLLNSNALHIFFLLLTPASKSYSHIFYYYYHIINWYSYYSTRLLIPFYCSRALTSIMFLVAQRLPSSGVPLNLELLKCFAFFCNNDNQHSITIFQGQTYHHFAFVCPDRCSKPLMGLKLQRFSAAIYLYHAVIWTEEWAQM